MNEKRGQPLEPFPFQSSKSWTRSFLASRLPARRHFLSSSSISGDTTFSPLPGKSLSLFLSWSLSSKESSVVNGLFEALQLLVLSLRSVRVNKSGIPLLFRSKLYAYDPITRDKFTSSTMDRTEWIITESIQYRFSHSYLHSIIHLHG